MNKFLKVTATAAALAAGLFAQSAFADTQLPGTGNGELVLYATYTDTAGTVFTYARGLGNTINDVNGGSNAALAADSTYAFGKSLSLSYSGVAADANLTTFLGNATTANATVSYAVLAGDTATSSGLTGSMRYLTTSPTAISSTTIKNANLRTNWNGLDSMQTTTNLAINSGVVLDKSSTFPFGEYAQGPDANMTNWNSGFNNAVALGSASSFYLFTTNTGTNGGGNTNVARVYTVGSFTLSSTGTLSFTSAGGTSVPLPAAAWLLGSGLLGLAGVGRRKKAA